MRPATSKGRPKGPKRVTVESMKKGKPTKGNKLSLDKCVNGLRDGGYDQNHDELHARLSPGVRKERRPHELLTSTDRKKGMKT